MSQPNRSDWTTSSIRELEGAGVIELGRGKVISQKDIEATPGDYPVYSSSASGNGEFGRYGKFMFDEELVTWSVDGGGKFFYRPSGKYSITNVSGFLRVRAKDKIDTYYAWAQLYSIWESMTFNYTEKLHPSILRERFPFSYPPLPEQSRIAHVLSSVQKAVFQQVRLIRTTTELKQALMQKLFTEGLRGEAQKETEIGLVPESWEVVRVEACGTIKSSAMAYSELEAASSIDAGVRVLGVKVSDMNLPGNEIEFRSANLERVLAEGVARKRAIPPYAVVFPKRGAAIATNKKRITTCYSVLDPNLIAVMPHETVDPRYLYHWFDTFDLRKITDPGPTPQLNKKDIAPLLMPRPRLEEQIEIASAIDAIDAKIKAHGIKQKALQDLFRTLLHELMTGKVRIE